MDSITRFCSVVGLAGLTTMSWMAVAWMFWPFVEETVRCLHQTYGF